MPPGAELVDDGVDVQKSELGDVPASMGLAHTSTGPRNVYLSVILAPLVGYGKL